MKHVRMNNLPWDAIQFYNCDNTLMDTDLCRSTFEGEERFMLVVAVCLEPAHRIGNMHKGIIYLGILFNCMSAIKPQCIRVYNDQHLKEERELLVDA